MQQKQKFHRHAVGIGLALVLLMVAGVSQAATVGFSGLGSIGTGNYGNVLNVNGSGGTSVTVTAFSILNHSGPFSQSQLYSWNAGLGTCNGNEGLASGNCPTGPHSTDNLGSDDFILVKFARSVTLNSATLTAWDPDNNSRKADSDVSYYLGIGMPDFSALGTEGINTTGRIRQGRARTFEFATSNPVEWLLIGGRRGQTNDGFKLKALDYDVVTTVPLPPAAILFVSGLMGLGGWFGRSAKV